MNTLLGKMGEEEPDENMLKRIYAYAKGITSN